MTGRIVRLIDIYLAVYAVLVAGALFTLYRSDLLQRFPAAWTGGSLLVAVTLGILLFAASRRPKPKDPEQP